MASRRQRYEMSRVRRTFGEGVSTGDVSASVGDAAYALRQLDVVDTLLASLISEQRDPSTRTAIMRARSSLEAVVNYINQK